MTSPSIAGSAIDWKGKFTVEIEVTVIQIIAPIKKATELVIKYILVFLELSKR